VADPGSGWEIVFAPRAEKDFRRVPSAMRARLLDAINTLVIRPPPGDVRKLQGSDDEWRLRVGEWRVRFTYVEMQHEVHILRVLPRGRAYRD
jgi:mRNA interferase RelE/StbE